MTTPKLKFLQHPVKSIYFLSHPNNIDAKASLSVLCRTDQLNALEHDDLGTYMVTDLNPLVALLRMQLRQCRRNYQGRLLRSGF